MPVRHSCSEQPAAAASFIFWWQLLSQRRHRCSTPPTMIIANATIDERISQSLTANLSGHTMDMPLSLIPSPSSSEVGPDTISSQLTLPNQNREATTAERVPQFRAPIDIDIDQQCSTASIAASDSCTGERKRCSLSALSEASAVALPNNPLFAHADLPLGALALSSPVSSSPPSHNKKRRVTFCKTTKPPATTYILQQPSTFAMKNITMKSVSCTSLPQLVPSSSCNSLLSESSTVELDLSVGPATFLKTIILQSNSITGTLRGEDIISNVCQRVNCESYFLKYNDEHLEAYTTDKVSAVQGNDIDKLRTLLKSGHLMQASNRFGESILHTSCRRGYTDMVQFFLHEAHVSPRVRDDMGRNPMHDACWSSADPNFDMMKLLIHAAPELLLSKDKRGHSPFDYARREHWPNWISFLNEHRQFIVTSLVASCLEGSDLPLSSAINTVGADVDGGGIQFTGWDNFSSE